MIKTLLASIFWAAVLGLLLPALSAAQSSVGTRLESLSVPSLDDLKNTLKSLDTDTSLSQESKDKLKPIVEESINNLERAAAFEKKQEEFTGFQITASEKIDKAQQQLVQITEQNRSANTEFDRLSVEQAQATLAQREAELLTINNDIRALQTELQDRNKRAAALRDRLTELQKQEEQTRNNLISLHESEVHSESKQLRSWQLLTQRYSLNAEISKVEEEIHIQPSRNQLLTAELDLKKAQRRKLTATIEVLQNALLNKRVNQVKDTLDSAEQTMQKLKGLSAPIQAYAKSNERMVTELAELTQKIRSKYHQRDQLKAQNTVLEREYNAVKMKIEIMGLSQEMGELVADQRNLLPDLHLFQNEREAVYTELTEITLKRLEVQNELGWRFDPQSEKLELLSSVPGTANVEELHAVDELIDQRREILKQLDESSDTYLSLLSETDQYLATLIQTITDYQRYLKSSLIWVRVPYHFFGGETNIIESEAKNLNTIVNLFEKTGYLNKSNLTVLAWHTLVMIAALGISGVTRKTRLSLRKSLRFSTANFSRVLQYLILIIFRVIPAALACYLFTYHIHHALFPNTIELLNHKLWAYVLLCGVLFHLAKPQGFLEEFLRWPKEIVAMTYSCAKILYFVASPILLAAFIPINALDNQGSGLIGSALIITCMMIFLYCAHRLLGLPYNLMESLRTHKLVSPASKAQTLFDRTILLFNSFWILCFVIGYRYASAKICAATFESLIVLFYSITIYQSILMWLRRVQVRQKVQLRQEKKSLQAQDNEVTDERDAALSAQRIDDLDKNIEELGDDSRKLIRLALWVIGLVVFYAIWSPLLPALAILNDVTLWTYETNIEGNAGFKAVTLHDFIVISVITSILAIASRRLPPFVEILIRNRLQLENGTMYTGKTLMSYFLLAAAIIYAGNALGFSWNKIQWAVAALSVGIGFGLQEIVANFISGLIILFERPIRVGDLVTIGQHTGTVRKIQIRATTIVDFDNKELLVPNKEFITTALLNWTLSDRQVRVMISVGISYKSDIDLALQILERLAKEHPSVLADPAPVVTFESFGESTLNLFLRCRIGSIDERLQVTTDLHKSITREYREHGIEIAYPQRDLHIYNEQPKESQTAPTVSDQ